MADPRICDTTGLMGSTYSDHVIWTIRLAPGSATQNSEGSGFVSSMSGQGRLMPTERDGAPG